MNISRAQLAAMEADGWVVASSVWTAAGEQCLLRREAEEKFVTVVEASNQEHFIARGKLRPANTQPNPVRLLADHVVSTVWCRTRRAAELYYELNLAHRCESGEIVRRELLPSGEVVETDIWPVAEASRRRAPIAMVFTAACGKTCLESMAVEAGGAR